MTKFKGKGIGLATKRKSFYNIDPLFSSESDEWGTPKPFFDFLNKIFKFEFDPCSSENEEARSRLGIKNCYTIHDNGLVKEWLDVPTFINPPYSQVARWVSKAIHEWNKRKQYRGPIAEPIVLLVAARTDTKWFHQLLECEDATTIFIQGRIQFDNLSTEFNKKLNSPTFPSAVIILGNYPAYNYEQNLSSIKINAYRMNKPVRCLSVLEEEDDRQSKNSKKSSL